MAEPKLHHRHHSSQTHLRDADSDDGVELFHLDEHGVKRDTLGWVANPAGQDASTMDRHGVALPHIEHRHESSSGELFFDLFFVANLMAFTKGHEINDRSTLADYVGFFCILWSTWLQVTMHDVRFPQESVFERVFKAVHLGVMIGFAVVGVFFDPSEGVNHGGGPTNIHGRALSRVLMASRLGLFAQYLLALFLVRRFKRMYLPLLLTAATYLISALIYLGVSYSYQHRESGAQAGSFSFVSWYIIAAAETAAVLTISVLFRGMSFRGSHITERMTLLTLIILGEGVIGLCSAIQSIWGQIDTGVGRHGVLSTFIGLLIGSILLLYLAFMIYFDNVPSKGFTDLRHSIWTALHLPLHIALVLMVEGNSKATVWVSACTIAGDANKLLTESPLFNAFINTAASSAAADPSAPLPPAMNSTMFFNQQASVLKGIADTYMEIKPKYASPGDTTKQTIAAALDGIKNGTQASPNEVYVDLGAYWLALIRHIFKAFGVEEYSASEKAKRDEASAAPFDASSAYDQTYESIVGIQRWWRLIYIYFFTAAGAFLVLVACMYFISRKTYHRADYVRSLVCLLAGLGLGLMSLMVLSEFGGPGEDYMMSPYMVPTITLTFAVVITVRHLPLHRILGERSRYESV